MLPFLNDAKKQASIIVDSIVDGEKDKTEEVDAEENGKHEDGMRIAGQEIMNALEVKDGQKLVRAIRSLMDMHSSGEG